MATITQQLESTLTRNQVMTIREVETKRLRFKWAMAAEKEKRRHKEALEHARRSRLNGKKDNSNVIIG